MRKHIYKALFLSLGNLVISCSEYTDGINTDPNNFPEASGSLLIGQANLSIVKLSSGQPSRIAGLWTDQFTGEDMQFIPLNTYLAIASDFDDDWNEVYTDGLKEARLAEIDAVETGDVVLEGVSQILQALMFGETAALWGDIPYSEALSFEDNPNPTYDSQSFVFEQVQQLLSSGIDKVEEVSVLTYGAPVYVSNEATWKQVAHTLKARYYLITKNYEQALIEARQGISSRNGDLLSFHSNLEGAQNLYYQFEAIERAGYLTGANSYLQKIVNNQEQRILKTPGDTERALVYFNDNLVNTNEDGFFAIDASFPIVSFYETKLIEAEAANRTSEDALTPFNEVRNELALEYGGDFPESTATGNDLLLEILEEKYITLIGSLQVYHDIRRTNNLIGVPIKNTTATSIPQRFLYPQAEINANSSFPGVIDLFVPTEINQ